MKRFILMVLVGLSADLALDIWPVGPDWLDDLAIAVALYGAAMCMAHDLAEVAFKGWDRAREKKAEAHAKEVFEILQRRMKEMFGDNVQFFDLDKMDEGEKPEEQEELQPIPGTIKH